MRRAKNHRQTAFLSFSLDSHAQHMAVATVRKGGQEGSLEAESTSWDMAHSTPKEQECVTGGH